MTTHEKAQIEFHRVAEVTKEGSVLNLDAAISAYLSALTPPDVAGLVDRLLTEERVSLGDKVAVKKLLERIAQDACEAALVLTELSSRVAEMERAATPPTGSYSGLIERLRRRSLESECSTGDPLAGEAASLITHLAAENALLREREGWKLVPVEPTEGMVCAVDHDDCSTPDAAERAYRAMLAASPSHQEQNND